MGGEEESVGDIFVKYLDRAESGEERAQVMVCLMLHEGGLGERKKEAFEWVEKAGERGNRVAEALRYCWGVGRERDRRECLSILNEYKREKGEGMSEEEMYVLEMTLAGILSFEGNDPKKAMDIFQKYSGKRFFF